MAESTPISPPETTNPLSPVSRTSSFPHKTSSSTAPTHAFIETSTPAINEFAVELDGAAIEAPSSKQTAEGKHTGEEEGQAGLKDKVVDKVKNLLGKKETGVDGKEGGSVGLGEEEDINEEFLGSGKRGAGKEVREKRAALLSTRSKDPGVIVDVPQDPTAEEVQAAKSAEGTITPANPANGDVEPRWRA